MPARNQKLELSDVAEVLESGEVKLGIKYMGKDNSHPAILVQMGGASTTLPAEATMPMFEAIVRVLVANGVHARKNPHHDA